MIQTFALGPERVVVVPNAAPPDSYFELPDVPAIREAMTTNPARIRLCYPALGYSHKNHEVLPETFRILRESHGIDDVALFVTVDASDSPNAGPFLSAIHALGLQERIVNLGRLDPSAIPTVFRNAHGLLMPTLLESFSLSYLEAMRFGVPILTSDYDFAREVCGDAALYFDPLDPGAVASAIARFTRHPEVERELRARTVERDRERDDSWADVTRKYVAILRSVCAGDRTRGTATASV
jgi:glycosyltransferase involved in cell wall biosynthesis